MTNVGIAVIGSGYMGQVYAEAITRLTERTRLVAIAGGTRAAGLARDYGTETEASPELAIARPDVDAVVVATPHSTHLPLALEAARAGKHVLVEKPLARTVAECRELVDGCRAAGVLLGVNKLTRFRDTPAATHRLIREGAVGEVRMVRVLVSSVGLTDEEVWPLQRWYTDPAEGSVYLDWGSHVCDMLRWLIGSEAVTAFAQFASYTDHPKPDQSGMAQYSFANGALAQIWMSSELPAPGLDAAQYLVVGPDGILDCDAYGDLRLGKGDSWEIACRQPPIDWDREPNHPNRIRGWALQIQDFVDAIQEGREPIVTGEDGLKAVEMVEAAERSHATRAVVELPLSVP
jgi:predicted dehydrogenase